MLNTHLIYFIYSSILVVISNNDVVIFRSGAISLNISFQFFTETDKYGHHEAPINFSTINKSIGYSLVIGFLFMFFIDQISKYLSAKG